MNCLYPPDALLDLFQGFFWFYVPPSTDILDVPLIVPESSRANTPPIINELTIIHRLLFSIQPQLKGISPQDMRGLRVDEVLKYYGPREENGTT